MWFFGLDDMPRSVEREVGAWWVPCTLFLGLAVLLWQILRWSPGQYCLGIVEQTDASHAGRLPWAFWRQATYRVDPWRRTHERWWTVLLALLAVPNTAGTLQPSALPVTAFASSTAVTVLHGVAYLAAWTTVVGLCRLRLFGVLSGILTHGIALGYTMCRLQSISCTRRRSPSIRRKPLPYKSFAIHWWTPVVSLTSVRPGRGARIAPRLRSRGCLAARPWK